MHFNNILPKVSFLASYNRNLHAFLFSVKPVSCPNYAIHLSRCTGIVCWWVEMWSTSLQRLIQPVLKFLCLGYECFFQCPAVEKSQLPMMFLSLCGKKAKSVMPPAESKFPPHLSHSYLLIAQRNVKSISFQLVNKPSVLTWLIWNLKHFSTNVKRLTSWASDHVVLWKVAELNSQFVLNYHCV